MEDLDIESEEEEKRSSVEPVKTWNMNNESSETTPPPAPQNQKEVKYVPKAVAKATRNPLDISNEMLFPTLGNAAEVEKELKKEEEENIRIQLEEKRKREEIEAAKPKR
jgi:translation initiation factor 1 (eIF-1/SUI1)